MGLIASYNTRITVRPPSGGKASDAEIKPLTIAQVNAAIEEAIRRVYWDAEPGGQSVEVHATAELTDR